MKAVRNAEVSTDGRSRSCAAKTAWRLLRASAWLGVGGIRRLAGGSRRHSEAHSSQAAWVAPMEIAIHQRFEFEAQKRVLVDYLHAVEESAERIQRLENDLAELVGSLFGSLGSERTLHNVR